MNKTLLSLVAGTALTALPAVSALAADYVQAPGSKLALPPNTMARCLPAPSPALPPR